ncbi:MAG: DUF3392 family protein [Paracoccaceae bacterium]|nr:DUF3392 family protein [Paracoccaceae bacterium]
MPDVEDLNSYLVDLTQLYADEISLAFVATCLVLFGYNINSFVRRRIIGYFFLFRIFIFILLCVFGYGLLTVTIQPVVHMLLLKIPREYSFLCVVISFIYLGYLAEKKRTI